MKKIIAIFVLISCFQITNASEEEKLNVPENISYYEYCYNSWQCEVPEDLQEIINENIQAIMSWEDPLY